jgi:hypothetical protein
LDNKFATGACAPLPLSLFVNPGGNNFAGVPNVPPVLEEIFSVECNEMVEDVVISAQSGQSFYRTTDPVFNQRYRARLFLFQVDDPGTYTIRAMNNTFAPFITVSRSFGVFWQGAGTSLTIDVSVEQTGPMTIEVTTEAAQTFGSFDLEVDCGSIVTSTTLYWKLDTIVGGPTTFTSPASSGGRDMFVSPPGITLVPGKIGNGLLASFITSTPGIDFASGHFTVRLWLFNPVPFQSGDVVFAFRDPLFGNGFSLRCNPSVVLDGTLQFSASGFGGVGGQTDNVAIPEGVWNHIVAGWDNDVKRVFIQLNNGTRISGPQIPINVFNIVNASVVLRPFASSRFDEVAVYLGKVWNFEETAYDWNGGAGRTFPDIP